MVTNRWEPVDGLVVALSTIGSFGAVWIGMALLLAVLWRHPRVFVLVVTGILTAEVAATGLKLLFARQRPYLVHDDPEPLMRTHLDLTLPSGHAATAFAGAVLLSFAVPRLAPLFISLAAAIAASRVYVGVHYPSDILLGAAVGAAVAIALHLLAGAPRRSARAQPRG